MISSNDVYFSPITMDDDLPQSAPNLPESVASSNFLDDFLMEMNLSQPDDADIPPIESNEIDDLLNGFVEGVDQAQAEIFEGGLPNSLGQSTRSSDIAASHQGKATETTRTNSGLVKTSGLQTRSNLINSPWLCETGQSLKLRTSPYPYQRARYERELKRDLRYTSTPGNNCIDFEMLELRSRISLNTSVIMRVSRTTTPYGPDGTVFCHPYPLWVKDEHAKVHHGSLLIDVTDQIMNNQPIKFEHLIMLRLKQVPLKGITQWPIYTSNHLDCNGFYSLDTNKPKTIIENYNLRYSALRFQIFFVDENQTAYPTDLSCETTSILEYEDKDRKDLSASFAPERKRQNKRLQQNSNTTRREKATKNWQPIPRENPDGVHPHSNR